MQGIAQGVRISLNTCKEQYRVQGSTLPNSTWCNNTILVHWQFVLTRSLQSENAGSSSTLSSSSHPHSAFVFAPAHCFGVPVSCQMIQTDMWYFEQIFCLWVLVAMDTDLWYSEPVSWCGLLWILTCDILNLFLGVGCYGYWPVIFWTCFLVLVAMDTDLWYSEPVSRCGLLWILTCDILNLFLGVGCYGYWPVIFWTCF